MLYRSLTCLCLLLLGSLISSASEPAWWVERGIIARDTLGNRLPSSDYSAVNQGQLKNFTAAAVAELNAKLPGGAGPVLEATIASWFTSDAPNRPDYATANIGQAKALASLVYDRLIAEGAATVYPWTGAANPASDYSLINIGQIKGLFAFDLELDTDTDGFSDFWEQRIIDADPNDAITGLGDIDGTGDFDGDGLSDADEWAQGTNPLSKDSDSDGMWDNWEVLNQFDPRNPADAPLDADNDGWSNLEEFLAGTNPRSANATLPGMTVETFTYDLADRLNAVTGPAPSTIGLDPENNILSSQ